MGNSQHRYLTNNEAIEIIGVDNWNNLRSRLDRQGGRPVDYEFFAAIIHSRYERMVRPPHILFVLL